ncbi:Rrf2 family transcriptional regulator [Paenibacillus urinalis]|uniref:Rrf2 family transcriptional regulator n=1 Tax=Paenibacillus urinalis TaxID=521520 RepID=A0AAX3MZ76_9BACL|nr:Rrf2 family transcriptional regulator [Paenibacillus urinalis]WDH82617.1 Rrf2 family transcriptional regulator [Paenibacillus urinalis]
MDSLLQLSYLGKTNFIVAIKSLAILAAEDDLVTSNALTEKLGVESSFIRKVMAKLMREHIVEGYGGRYGGYKLLVNPEETTLYDIYAAIAKDAHSNEADKMIDDMDQIISEIMLESQQKIKEVLSKHSINDLTKGK